MRVNIDGQTFDFIDAVRVNPKIDRADRFFIVKWSWLFGGFFINHHVVCAQIIDALRAGLIPVVDFANYKTLYTEDEPVNGTRNTWEYYFMQPTGRSVEDAYAANHRMAKLEYNRRHDPVSMGMKGFKINAGKLAVVNNVMAQLMKPNSIVLSYHNNDMKLMRDPEHTIGVHVRGTDHRRWNGVDQDTPSPDTKRYIILLDKYLNKNPDNSIFLATDETAVAEEFDKRYHDRLIYLDVYRAPPGQVAGIHKIGDGPRHNHKYLLGLEALRDGLMLSRCGAFMHSNSNVAIWVIMKNGGKFRERIWIKPNPISRGRRTRRIMRSGGKFRKHIWIKPNHISRGRHIRRR